NRMRGRNRCGCLLTRYASFYIPITNHYFKSRDKSVRGGRMRILKRIFMACLFVSIACVEVLAQSTMTGTVKDQSGAVLPGVSVESSSAALNERSRSTIKDESRAHN